MTTEEIIKELEEIKKSKFCFRAASYDYCKAWNDAQWHYHNEINKLIAKLNNPKT